MPQDFLSPIEDVIEDARNGRMYILIDDEDRENEGDLIIPAQMATPDAINFMAKHGRGLICLSMTSERIKNLGLELMGQQNQSRHNTAFTVSIEAMDGVTTGISAADRAHTIAVAIDAAKSGKDLATPGHVFPIQARDGGVLVRAGHTEASVDISRLAGLNPSAVICEIMNDDGTMARLPDLVKFAQFHGLKVATIRDLIAYRRLNDNLVECKVETPMTSEFGGDWKLKTYVNRAEYAEHLVLVKGDVDDSQPTLVRMHGLNLFDDVLAETNKRAGQLNRVMQMIGDEGCGVVVIIRDIRPTRLSEMMQARNGDAPNAPAHNVSVKGHKPADLKDYGIGAQILCDLGLKDLILLSNTKQHIIGLEGYGLNIVEQRPITENTEG